MVFRVEVTEKSTGRPTQVYVSAETADEAVAIANRGGRFNASSAEAVDVGDVPLEEPLLRAPRSSAAGGGSAVRFFDLNERPIVTIAAGVFTGLLAWTVFVFMVALVSGQLAGL
ncbi:MAG: hypothetical protein AAF138_04565 [Planctomycetota bacterium]